MSHPCPLPQSQADLQWHPAALLHQHQAMAQGDTCHQCPNTALGWHALSVAKHCSSLQETTEMSRDFKTPLWPTGHHPLLQLIFYPHSEQRSPARILQAAQSHAFLYFSPSKLEMRGTPLPFNQTLLLPLQPPAGFCFLPKNSLYHSLPLVKCPIDFSLYVSSSRTWQTL